MIKFALFLLVALVAQNEGVRLGFGSLSRRTPRLDGRIVGGKATPIEQLPYQLSLMYNGGHYCGACIISSEWLITAAHCVADYDPSILSARAGSSSQVSGGSIHRFVQVVIHPSYDFWSSNSDYALVRVDKPFPLGQPGVAAIPLAEVEPVAGVEGVVSGWGRLSSNGERPSTLQSVTVPVVSRETCSSLLHEYISDRMLCAGYKEGGKDSCQGDSGGPFAVDGKLAGIVSWGFGCALPNSPGVYASVAKEVSWIRTISGVGKHE